MKFLWNFLLFLINRFLKRLSIGESIRIFAEHMGITYIKLAQMLAMQNIDNLFEESDRQMLLHICDDCNRVDFKTVENILYNEYGESLYTKFKTIEQEPVGSASVSQVHKAVLPTGKSVVLKVKRKDICHGIEHDILLIKSLLKIFGRLFGFTNILGGECALNLYLKWILEETDFLHEIENIKVYTEFAMQVNGAVPNTKKIIVPKVYEDLSTSNVIVMEYISYPTISNMGTDAKTSKDIIEAFSSYVKLSFHALFTDTLVVWHGDPHAGNVFIDKDGNVGFLDMGLLFRMTAEDAELTKRFFFAAYLGRADRLYELLAPYLKGNEKKHREFKERCVRYCEETRTKPITNLFMDMVPICLKFSIKPPDFLFGMGKAFACIGGIDVVYHNKQTGIDLLKEQVIKYFVDTSIQSGASIVENSVEAFVNLVINDRFALSSNLKNIVDSLHDIMRYL